MLDQLAALLALKTAFRAEGENKDASILVLPITKIT
jgi:hypothetical protein